jgi:uncharacterized protein
MNEWNRHDRTTRSVLTRASRLGILGLVASVVLSAGCASERGRVSTMTTNVDPTLLAESPSRPVDCVLPGQIRQLGHLTYLTASRVVRTSATDCEIRGGTPEGPKAASASFD